MYDLYLFIPLMQFISDDKTFEQRNRITLLKQFTFIYVLNILFY